ncbi:hypothetical protein OG223_53115 [Streptomyces sp. NBC_01478]|uniref:hypothetical protein n=1 Tax=Streptomyces sp. NBC_01478 TaxID=2903882 RepID=UPI002E2EDCD9|nr:hypothetical protein [Streptomyces sp. NBC_01478]
MSTLRVDVLAFDMPCQQCAMPLRWVFGLLPSHRPDGDEFTTTDFPEAVDVARSILTDPAGGCMDLAAQLHGRPARQRGRSFNPNTCGSCGHQADWHVLGDVIHRALHEGWIRVAESRVPVPQWRAIRGRGQGISWPFL